MNKKTEACPCGSGQVLASCCSLLLEGRSADTAEQLMRSRYTAYVFGDEKYLLKSWHKKTRPVALNLSQQEPPKWIRLKVLSHTIDPGNPDKASVEFVARYKVNGKAQKIHELSRFSKENGHWSYVDGDLS
jgi:SEC-C motif-containing protein